MGLEKKERKKSTATTKTAEKAYSREQLFAATGEEPTSNAMGEGTSS